MSEQSRRSNNTQRALDLLLSKPRVSNVELCAVAGMRAVGGRLHELRRLGHRIDTERGEGGLYFYRYVHGPGEGPAQLHFGGM